MASNEIDDKKRLIELANAVRQKFDKFRHGEADYTLQMERKYKPLMKLHKDEKQKKSNSLVSDDISFSDTISSEDPIFGLKRYVDGTYYLGEYPVSFYNNKINVSDREYEVTNGLLSLLTRKIPQDYTDLDLESYKEMLLATSAHLRKTDNQIKSNRGAKSKFIKKLFQPEKDASQKEKAAVDYGEIQAIDANKTVDFFNSPQAKQFFNNLTTENNLINRLLTLKRNVVPTHSDASSFSPEVLAEPTPSKSKDSDNFESGRGMQMKVLKAKDHVKNLHTYWDDPNELVDRLCLLHASREAGNTNVANEIISIVTELRQARYIY